MKLDLRSHIQQIQEEISQKTKVDFLNSSLGNEVLLKKLISIFFKNINSYLLFFEKSYLYANDKESIRILHSLKNEIDIFHFLRFSDLLSILENIPYKNRLKVFKDSGNSFQKILECIKEKLEHTVIAEEKS